MEGVQANVSPVRSAPTCHRGLRIPGSSLTKYDVLVCVDTRTPDWLVMRGPMASIVRGYDIKTTADD